MKLDWYTVPAEYGGRSLPLFRRLYIEWLWRKHGAEGLDQYMERRWKRAMERNLPRLKRALEGTCAATEQCAQAFNDAARVLREADENADR